MMKKSLFLTVCVLLACMVGLSLAEELPESRTSSLWVYSLLPDSTAAITGYKGNAVALAVPPSLDDIPVSAISYKALRKVSGLVNVILPEGVTVIEDHVFDDDFTLENIALPETLTLHRYQAQNGTIVNYYLYLPKAVDPAEKLPILIYFHGTRDTLARHHGLGELIRTNQAEPKGIVILPQTANETVSADFHSGRYQDAVIELANGIAAEHNGDTDRLSVSGHSDGGSTAYQIVNGHPGMFAACAPISGIGNIGQGIQETYLWVFQGAKDYYVKPNVGLRVVLKCEQRGCHAMHYIYPDKDHDIQTLVFQDTFIDENGDETKLIDWLMSKELNR